MGSFVKWLCALGIAVSIGVFPVAAPAHCSDTPRPAVVGYDDPVVSYEITVWICNFEDVNGNFIGGAAGEGAPPEPSMMGAPPEAVSGNMLIEKRQYDENGNEYTVLERTEYSISFGP